MDVTVEQTPKYETFWVISKPKLDYIEGESLDLTGMVVKVGDTNEADYIGPDRFSAYGLVLCLGYEEPELSFDEIITWDMNNNYIYIYNTNNDSYARIGRVTVQ